MNPSRVRILTLSSFSHLSCPLLYGRPHLPHRLLRQRGRRTAVQAAQQHRGGFLLCALRPVHFFHHRGPALRRESLLTRLTYFTRGNCWPFGSRRYKLFFLGSSLDDAPDWSGKYIRPSVGSEGVRAFLKERTGGIFF